MTRTSYGPKKLEQSWKLLRALLEAHNMADSYDQNDQGVEIGYGSWDATEHDGTYSLEVRATLAELSRLSGLSIEDLRESLNEHLSRKFLGILNDRREKKYGVSQWVFEIAFWSSDFEENYAKFCDLWKLKKGKNSSKATVSASSRLNPSWKKSTTGKNELWIDDLNSPLESCLEWIKEILGLFSLNKLKTKEKLTQARKYEIVLETLGQACGATSCSLWKYRSRDGSWSCSSQSGDSAPEYLNLVSQEILPHVPEHVIFASDSHGRKILLDEQLHLLIPMHRTSQKDRKKPSLVAICDVEEYLPSSGEAGGKIISALLDIDAYQIEDLESIEAFILDALKDAFSFVPKSVYERRFELFCKRLNTMTVYFQPILKLDNLKLEGWEALARDPQTKRSPADLFRAAELWGVKFMTELDLYFLNSSSALYALEYDRLKLLRPDDIKPLSVNVYPDSLMRDAYLQSVVQLTKKGNRLRGNLILEISEKSALPRSASWNSQKPDWKSFRQRLRVYFRKRTEVKFAIDDFGVGHASISRLVGLNLAYVKIDREILNYEDDVRDRIINFVHDALIDTGNDNPHIVLEGVDDKYLESSDDRSLLNSEQTNDIGTFIQGYAVDQAIDHLYENNRLPKHRYQSLSKKLESVL